MNVYALHIFPPHARRLRMEGPRFRDALLLLNAYLDTHALDGEPVGLLPDGREVWALSDGGDAVILPTLR